MNTRSNNRITIFFLLAPVFLWFSAGDANAETDTKKCDKTVMFRNMPGRTLINYRQIIDGGISWYLETGRTTSQKNAFEIENEFRQANLVMEQFIQNLEKSVSSKEKIANTITRLIEQLDIVTGSARNLVNHGQKVLEQNKRFRKEIDKKMHDIDDVIRASECDLSHIESVGSRPNAGHDKGEVAQWMRESREAIQGMRRNVIDVRNSLQSVKGFLLKNIEAVNRLIESSLRGIAGQFEASTGYIFTGFRSMQTSGQFVEIKADLIRFPTLKEITIQNIAHTEKQTKALINKLRDLEERNIGRSVTPEYSTESSWRRVTEALKEFQDALDKMARSLEAWSFQYWENRLAKEVTLKCPLTAYEYDVFNNKVDTDTRKKIQPGQKVIIRKNKKEIRDQKYMIISVKGDELEKYHSPYRTALAVVTASLPESGGKCKK